MTGAGRRLTGMLTATVVLLAFACAAGLDLVVLAWHRAREKGRVHLGALLAAAHEALALAPLLLVVGTADERAYAIAGASIVGTVVANEIGLRWWARKESPK